MAEETLAILGGSGVYALDGLTDVRELPTPTPFGDPADVLVEGWLGPLRLLFLPRHGRGHRIPAHAVNYRANVFALKARGATQLLSLSAVGSLQEAIAPGDVIVVDQYIDHTKRRVGTFFESGLVVHASLADPVDAALANAVAQAAEAEGARVHRGGTYVCIDGPQFSTRAESHLYRSWGADVIGMTNLPEARLAREAELPYASLCVVTDYDCWHPAEAPVQVSAVLDQLRRNAALSKRIVQRLAQCVPPSASSPHSRTLDNALLTPASALDPATREQLAPLLERVLAARSSSS